MTSKETRRKMDRLFPPATKAEVAAAHAKYKAEDARIQALYAEQRQREIDEWCAKTGGTEAEYIELYNFSEMMREKREGA